MWTVRSSRTSRPSHKRTVRPDGAEHQWRKMPPRELSVDLVSKGSVMKILFIANMMVWGLFGLAQCPQRII